MSFYFVFICFISGDSYFFSIDPRSSITVFGKGFGGLDNKVNLLSKQYLQCTLAFTSVCFSPHSCNIKCPRFKRKVCQYNMWKWLFSWMKLLISKGAYISMNLFIISPYSLGLSPLLSLSITSCPHANFLCLSLVPPARFLTPKVNFVILFCLMSSNLGGSGTQTAF